LALLLVWIRVSDVTRSGSTILDAMLGGVPGATVPAPVVAAIMKIDSDVEGCHTGPADTDRS
jgi:hypothetical protein